MVTSSLITTFEKDNCPGVHIVRPEVAAFAIEMEGVLQKNDHKTGWDKLGVYALFSGIRREFDELDSAYHNYIDSEDEVNIQRMRDEALDIANFCMFLCHNYPKTEL